MFTPPVWVAIPDATVNVPLLAQVPEAVMVATPVPLPPAPPIVTVPLLIWPLSVIVPVAPIPTPTMMPAPGAASVSVPPATMVNAPVPAPNPNPGPAPITSPVVLSDPPCPTFPVAVPLFESVMNRPMVPACAKLAPLNVAWPSTVRPAAVTPEAGAALAKPTTP